MTNNKTNRCWICGSSGLKMIKSSNIPKQITSNSFAITDSNYGITGNIYSCPKCHFLQCSDLDNVLSFYEQLEDKEYEAGREMRAIQAKKLLEIVHHHHDFGRLLDIGAGSGIFVEQALKLGYEAEGIEPSRWLQSLASEHGLKVHLGTFPNPNIHAGIDVITLVDVIEHVSNPVELLSQVREHMSDDGVGLVVTPNLNSLVARFMGWKWWHFRIAHIGYFNKSTLLLALKQAGLEPIRIGCPSWYFSANYLLERINQYLPRFFRIPAFTFLQKVIVPLNLRDSLYIVFRKHNKGQ